MKSSPSLFTEPSRSFATADAPVNDRERTGDFTVHIQNLGSGWAHIVGKQNLPCRGTIALIFSPLSIVFLFSSPSMKEGKIKIVEPRNAFLSLFLKRSRGITLPFLLGGSQSNLICTLCWLIERPCRLPSAAFSHWFLLNFISLRCLLWHYFVTGEQTEQLIKTSLTGGWCLWFSVEAPGGELAGDPADAGGGGQGKKTSLAAVAALCWEGSETAQARRREGWTWKAANTWVAWTAGRLLLVVDQCVPLRLLVPVLQASLEAHSCAGWRGLVCYPCRSHVLCIRVVNPPIFHIF